MDFDENAVLAAIPDKVDEGGYSFTVQVLNASQTSTTTQSGIGVILHFKGAKHTLTKKEMHLREASIKIPGWYWKTLWPAMKAELNKALLPYDFGVHATDEDIDTLSKLHMTATTKEFMELGIRVFLEQFQNTIRKCLRAAKRLAATTS